MGEGKRLLWEIEQGPPKEDQFIFTQALPGSLRALNEGERVGERVFIHLIATSRRRIRLGRLVRHANYMHFIN